MNKKIFQFFVFSFVFFVGGITAISLSRYVGWSTKMIDSGTNSGSLGFYSHNSSGTQNPTPTMILGNNLLELNGKIKITDGTQGEGKILTSNADGTASWTNNSANIELPPTTNTLPCNNSNLGKISWNAFADISFDTRCAENAHAWSQSCSSVAKTNSNKVFIKKYECKIARTCISKGRWGGICLQYGNAPTWVEIGQF